MPAMSSSEERSVLRAWLEDLTSSESSVSSFESVSNLYTAASRSAFRSHDAPSHAVHDCVGPW